MSSDPLLDNTDLNNVYRVRSTKEGYFSGEYPEILRGIIQKGEYDDYLKRINETVYIPRKHLLITYIMCIIIALVVISGTSSVGLKTSAISFSIVFCIINFSALMYLIKVYVKKKQARRRAETIIEEINQRLYSRGVRF